MEQDWNSTCQESWGTFPMCQCLGLRDLAGESRAQVTCPLTNPQAQHVQRKLLLGLGWTLSRGACRPTSSPVH